MFPSEGEGVTTGGVPDGVGVPKGGVPNGVGCTGDRVTVGERSTGVKYAGCDTWQGGVPFFVNVTWTNTSLLIASGFSGIEKMANPSGVVFVVAVLVLWSGHRMVAVAVAPSTPTGFSSTVCTNFAKMLMGWSG